MTLDTIFRSAEHPEEYVKDFLRLFRPALSRIIKKANTQIKDTKKELDRPHVSGILLLANDDFLSLEPQFILNIVGELLTHSYSSIDAFVYFTLNHYVEIPGNDYANLIWVPTYSERAPNSLVDFVNKLGNQWSQFLEIETGKFDNKLVTDDSAIISRSRAIPRQPM